MELFDRKSAIAFGLLFPLFLIGLLVWNLLAPDHAYSDEENRVLESFPAFTLPTYMEGRYEEHLESYLSDQYIARDALIRVKTSFDRATLRTESNGVFFGLDGYLLEDIQVPSEELLTGNRKALEDFQKQHPQLSFAFLLAPNSANINRDKLPSLAQTADQDAYIDAFYGSLEELGYQTIDVRPLFRENQSSTQLYYRTDHHWTSDGAYLAFQELQKDLDLSSAVTYDSLVVKDDFRGTLASRSGFNNGISDAIKIYMPQGDPYQNSIIYYFDTKEKTTEFYRLDSLDTKDAYTVFGGSNHPIYTIETPVSSGRCLLLIKDSYANSVIPFLSQCYRKIVVVDPRYYFDDVNQLIQNQNVTDVLFLYNANTFFTDDSVQRMVPQA